MTEETCLLQSLQHKGDHNEDITSNSYVYDNNTQPSGHRKITDIKRMGKQRARVMVE